MAQLALRPLSTGEILDGAFVLLRRHFGLLFGIAVVCQGVPTAVELYIELASGGRVDPMGGLIIRILNAVGTLLVTGATVRAVSDAYLGAYRDWAMPSGTGWRSSAGSSAPRS